MIRPTTGDGRLTVPSSKSMRERWSATPIPRSNMCTSAQDRTGECAWELCKGILEGGEFYKGATQPLPTVLGYGMGGCRSGGERVGAGHTRPFPRSEWCRRTLGRRLIPPPCSGCLLGSSLWSQSMPVTVLEGPTSGTCQTAVEGAAKQSDEAN